MQSISSAPRTAGNENSHFLKYTALLFMVLDHVGAAFFPRVMFLRVLGRIAFPLYAWCLVVGSEYTKNAGRYAMRLLIFGIISQPCYMLALNAEWYDLNIFFTRLLALLAIMGVKNRRFGSQIWAPLLCISFAFFIPVDYGWKGVIFILLLYMARNNKGGIAALVITFCLFWNVGSYSGIFAFPVSINYNFPELAVFLSSINQIQFFALMALPLMIMPVSFRWIMPKWLGYALYPLHLFLIGLIRFALQM